MPPSPGARPTAMREALCAFRNGRWQHVCIVTGEEDMTATKQFELALLVCPVAPFLQYLQHLLRRKS